MRYALTALLFVAVLSWGAEKPYQQVKDLADKAASKNDAAGATELAGYLGQALALASQAASVGPNKIDDRRHAEEVANDIQNHLAKLTAPEASKALIAALGRLPARGQAIGLIALKSHPASAELDKGVADLMNRSNDFQTLVACLEVLGEHKAKEQAPSILKQLKDSAPLPVQIAACRALALAQDKPAVPALITYLGKHKFGRMRFEACGALQALTGQKFTTDAATWQNWWSKNEATFTGPAAAAPVLNYELTEPSKEEVTYYEIPVVESRILFVIDTSGSMKFGGSPNRMDRVKTELKSLIARLTDRVLFNIVTYSEDSTRWQTNQALVPATEQGKKAAMAFVDQISPEGGTQTMEALETALFDIALAQNIETIFLVTDGAPAPIYGGKRQNATAAGIEDNRKRIEFINQVSKVRINTIGVYTKHADDAKIAKGYQEPDPKMLKEFLQRVAKENDGTYKEVN